MISKGFEYTSSYLVEAVGDDLGARQITLRANGNQGASQALLLLDPNTCALDQFGDPTVCTLIAIRSHPVTLRRLAAEDGKELYAIDAEGYTGPALRLALLRAADPGAGRVARLLVMDERGGISRVLNLHPPVR